MLRTYSWKRANACCNLFVSFVIFCTTHALKQFLLAAQIIVVLFCTICVHYFQMTLLEAK